MSAPRAPWTDRLLEVLADGEWHTYDELAAAAQIKDKPAAVIDKIVQGKIDKFVSSICLMEQGFIKDPELTIEQLVKSMIAKLGENIQIRRFTRYAIGEEI